VRHDGALTILAHPDGDAYLGLHLDVECGPGVVLIMAQLFLYPYVEGAEIPVHLDDAR
jgi:hypothetical protein